MKKIITLVLFFSGILLATAQTKTINVSPAGSLSASQLDVNSYATIVITGYVNDADCNTIGSYLSVNLPKFTSSKAVDLSKAVYVGVNAGATAPVATFTNDLWSGINQIDMYDPESNSYIPNPLFTSSDNLGKIIIPDHITTLDHNFCGSSFRIYGKGVTYLSNFALAYSRGYISVDLGDWFPNLQRIDDSVLYSTEDNSQKNDTYLLKSITFGPNFTNVLGDWFLQDIPNLKDIYLNCNVLPTISADNWPGVWDPNTGYGYQPVSIRPVVHFSTALLRTLMCGSGFPSELWWQYVEAFQGASPINGVDVSDMSLWPLTADNNACTFLGVDENHSETKPEIFCVSNTLNIKNIDGVTSFVINNINGQTIYNCKNVNASELNMPFGYPKGIYSVILNYSDKQQKLVKFIN